MPTDRQTTGMAGEFLVVGKLFKREIQASVTFGNAKSIDVLAYNPRNDKSFAISVKTLRKRNCFPLNPKSVSAAHTYIFVILNEPDSPEAYFIVPGADIVADFPRFFGSSVNDANRPAVNYGPLRAYENNWPYFE
jgi:hypothetical protein